MRTPTAAADQHRRGKLVDGAAGLLCQQLWCWGQDILRPEGNWLLEIGFDRIPPPDDRDNCSSVYSLELPRERYVVLRGFGAFYGDRARGAVFLPRYQFRPKHTTEVVLDRPPWSDQDLPNLTEPSESQLELCAQLTMELIDWIRGYESHIVTMLGCQYRHATLSKFDNGRRAVTPAEEMPNAWRALGESILADMESLLPSKSRKRSRA